MEIMIILTRKKEIPYLFYALKLVEFFCFCYLWPFDFVFGKENDEVRNFSGNMIQRTNLDTKS